MLVGFAELRFFRGLSRGSSAALGDNGASPLSGSVIGWCGAAVTFCPGIHVLTASFPSAAFCPATVDDAGSAASQVPVRRRAVGEPRRAHGLDEMEHSSASSLASSLAAVLSVYQLALALRSTPPQRAVSG